MFSRFFVLLFVVFLTATFLGCGAEKEEIILGEEVIVEKWIDPTDVGEEYVVKDVVHGDTVFLSTTSKQYTIGEFDGIAFTEQGVFITTYIVKPDPHRPNSFIAEEEIPRGYVVPEGPPIVSLYSEDLFFHEGILGVGLDRLKDRPIRKHNNVQQWETLTYMNYSVGIDRVLDHNLLVYVEYQALNKPEDGGEVGRGRQLILILKGETFVSTYSLPRNDIYGSYDKISVRVLPYTDMNDIDLPVEVDNFDTDYRRSNYGLSKKDITVIAGHTFRPYRIASSSFFMQQAIPTKSDW